MTTRGPSVLVRRSRDFRALWIGETTSAVGTNVSRVALPLLAVLVLGASTFQVALLTAAGWVPWLLIGLPAGAWVDRLARCRPLLLACNLLSAALLLSVPVRASTGELTLGYLLGIAVLVGGASVVFETAFSAYLPGVVPVDDVPAANAALQGSASAAQVGGPGLAGLIARLAGPIGGLVVDAATFLVSTLCLLRVRAPETRPAPGPRPGLVREIAEGLRYLGRDPYLRVLTAFGAASNLALIGYQALLVVFLVRELDLGPTGVGLVLSGAALGGVFGAAAAGPVVRRFGTARGLLVCQFGAAPFALLIPLAAPGAGALLVVLGGLGVGIGVVAGNVVKTAFRQTYVPRELLGRVAVSMQIFNYGAIPLGALGAGALGTALGVRPALWIATSGLLAAACLLLLGPLRHHRDLPAAPLVPERPRRDGAADQVHRTSRR